MAEQRAVLGRLDLKRLCDPCHELVLLVDDRPIGAGDRKRGPEDEPLLIVVQLGRGFGEEVVQAHTCSHLIVDERADVVRLQHAIEALAHDPLDTDDLVLVDVAIDAGHQHHRASKQRRQSVLIQHDLYGTTALSDPGSLLPCWAVGAPNMDDLHINTPAAALVIPARDLSWTAARSSGPGGQNVNRVASKVDLRFDLANNESLHPALRARLAQHHAARLDAQGRLVVVSQSARTQAGNLALARERLAAWIEAATVVRKKRRPTKPTRGGVRRRLEAKKRQGEKKASRRWRGD